MPISNKTRVRAGLPSKADPATVDADQVASALGVQTRITTVEDRIELAKAEEGLLQSRALTVEDDPWNQLPNERRTNLIKPVYDPVVLTNLCLQNNALGQCVDAMEVNIDGTGFDIERKDQETPEDEEEDANLQPLKDFFNTIFINESFTSIRRKLRHDAEQTGNAYLEVIRNQAGEITLVNYLDAKLVRLVKLDDPVEVEKEILRGGTSQTVRMALRERRYAQLIGNKVRYFREFGSSREVNAETGEWMGPAKKAPPSKFKAPEIAPELNPDGSPKTLATNDFDKVPEDKNPNPFAPKPGEAPQAKPGEVNTESLSPEDELAQKRKKKPFAVAKAIDTQRDTRTDFPGVPDAKYSTAPRPEDDPTKRPDHEASMVNALPGTEVIHIRVKPDVSTPYGIPRWINQIPSVLGSRKAEELNLEYFNHGGLPPVMVFLQGGQLAPKARDALTQYLSGEAKTKMRGVIAEVYSTGGDLTSNSQVKVNVERFGGDRLNDSMFEGYDERCAGRVRAAFRLPPLFTGDTQDYTFATAYASYVVAEAQVFKPERELFDEIVNNTIMRELAPDYVYRSLPLTVHDVAVQLQAMTLAKDVSDRKTFVDELNEIAGLNLTFQDPLTDPMNPLAAMMGAGADPFGGEDQDPDGENTDKPPFGNQAEDKPPFGKKPNPFGSKPNPFDTKTKMQTPVGGPKVAKPTPKKMPANFAKASRERVMKLGDETIAKLAEDWAAHLSGDRQFEAASVNLMKSLIDGFNPQVRKLFTAYVGLKLAPGAKYDPEGVSDLIACAGDCLHKD